MKHFLALAALAVLLAGCASSGLQPMQTVATAVAVEKPHIPAACKHGTHKPFPAVSTPAAGTPLKDLGQLVVQIETRWATNEVKSRECSCQLIASLGTPEEIKQAAPACAIKAPAAKPKAAPLAAVTKPATKSAAATAPAATVAPVKPVTP